MEYAKMMVQHPVKDVVGACGTLVIITFTFLKI